MPHVFHRTNRGRPLKGFRKSWLDACREARRAGRIPHDFRRTAVRNLERAGVPRSTAMKMVGHKTESVYRRYAIVDEAMLREGGAKLAAYSEGKVLGKVADNAESGSVVTLRKEWWAGTGLNRRHQDFQSCAADRGSSRKALPC